MFFLNDEAIDCFMLFFVKLFNELNALWINISFVNSI